ncbi:hypothetical protein GLOTRDRAFT_120751 [Gloeophyllum trabeum ATCC 11539]|uniref:G-protein coupled receptors family 1 profile domain-containing protein n=1 Tax=Gloeophyllum trabeum (strain ATCC 11539 / FP-39264 / Madison 617) TaxID=670483 RepID=S7Q9A1_GLOTA|nr:uncharacterized protein GLOTRDRAFT_120751 [Gloeophyllum trabeum ATCC 11539]EPQ56092.1 hypothetical protein GLOTRDRAFT_120751 [Gloeophyllum trabeum ATCC 11539]
MPISSFTWGPDKQRVVVWTAVVPTIFSLVAALVVLALAFAIWHNPTTRPSLGRQSLRMLLWVQVMSLVYSGTYLTDEMYVPALLLRNFIDFTIMLIPINLQLALVHGIRTDGFVRWYLFASLGAAVVTALPGCIKRIWGWDPEALICWVTATRPSTRTAWEVGAFYAWIIISMTVASISTLIVLGHLVRHARSRVVEFKVTFGDSAGSGGGSARRQRGSVIGGNARIVRRAAWRILLYPIILVINNCISATANFLITRDNGIDSYGTYVVWAASGCAYGLLPGAYAVIAVFVDPSFSCALRTLFSPPKRDSLDSLEMGFPRRQRKCDLAATTRIEIELITQVVSDGVPDDQEDAKDGVGRQDDSPSSAATDLPEDTKSREDGLPAPHVGRPRGASCVGRRRRPSVLRVDTDDSDTTRVDADIVYGWRNHVGCRRQARVHIGESTCSQACNLNAESCRMLSLVC